MSSAACALPSWTWHAAEKQGCPGWNLTQSTKELHIHECPRNQSSASRSQAITPTGRTHKPSEMLLWSMQAESSQTSAPCIAARHGETAQRGMAHKGSSKPVCTQRGPDTQPATKAPQPTHPTNTQGKVQSTPITLTSEIMSVKTQQCKTICYQKRNNAT